MFNGYESVDLMFWHWK